MSKISNLKKTFFGSPETSKSRSTNSGSFLNIEKLEERQMLSTVDIVAAGATGDETLELVLDGQTVATFENVGGDTSRREFVTLSYDTSDYINSTGIELRFTNDVYDPQNGVDRNILIDRVIVRFGKDGTPEEREFYTNTSFNFEAEDPTVFSTGTWLPSDGNTAGFGRGEWLTSNGSMKFDGTLGNRGAIAGASTSNVGTVVEINAKGSTGDEQFNLLVDQQVVKTFHTTQELREYRYVSSQALSADQIRIEFTNDYYAPAFGVDRNLTVSSIRLNNDFYETEAPTTLSTGTYVQGQGVVTGFPQSETLHTNGYFQFLADYGNNDTIQFAGQSWDPANGLGSSQLQLVGDVLVVSGNLASDASVSREVTVNGGELYELTVDAYREILAGSFDSDASPWATVGINFYDGNGNYISQQTIEVNSPRDAQANGFKRKQFLTPDTAVSGRLWIWAGQTDRFQNIPLKVRDIQFTEFTSDDTTPPTVVLNRPTITSPTDRLTFSLDVEDPSGLTGLNGPNTEITLLGPGGYELDVNSIAGGGLPNGTFFIYEIAPRSGSAWTSADNGTYAVRVNSGEFQDGVGNVVAEQIVGTFEIAIS